ncbi:MAG: hypothetical protein WC530_02590 [Candidatus Omnitrophota bacterium]
MIESQYQASAADQEIDQLVYQLYGLTADEIKIVDEFGVCDKTLRNKIYATFNVNI